MLLADIYQVDGYYKENFLICTGWERNKMVKYYQKIKNTNG